MSVLEYNEELHLKNVHKDGLDEGISGAVAILRSMGVEDSVIIQKICNQFNLSENDAAEYL